MSVANKTFSSLNEVMLKEASEENSLHLSVVAQGSSRRLSSAGALCTPPPSPPSILPADMQTQSRKPTAERIQQSRNIS